MDHYSIGVLDERRAWDTPLPPALVEQTNGQLTLTA